MSTTTQNKPVQLQLEGLETVHPLIRQGDLDPRFILSDETCRNGLRHIAEIRQRMGVAPRTRAA